MSPKLKLRNYFHTIKALKPIQVTNRILRRYRLISLQSITVSVLAPEGSWQNANYNTQSYYPADKCFCFLNHSVTNPSWNDPEQNKLWLYNLHYFDDLNAANSHERTVEHAALINRWIEENPAAKGNGWEPYPLSLRLVNWLKWALAGNTLDEPALASLGLQSHVLRQSLEYHLLGNHLFANAKALLFAGVCLQGREAAGWRTKGEAILLKELDEQFLTDGANFELSPMYHAILLADCLDIVNLSQAYPNVINPKLLEKLNTLLPKALHWLAAMSHHDGELSFFNDATHGIAWQNTDIFAYAQSLGFSFTEPRGLIDLEPSGFVAIKQTDYSFIADLSEIGPSYIPGHAHADTLSFEWCLYGQRVFVNSGISEYGISDERLRQRQTPAHNTVTVNGLSSTEVWSGFRVARRAHIVSRVVETQGDQLFFSASHDGFKRQGLNCIHHREFKITANTITLVDHLQGEFEEAKAYFILHPDVSLKLNSPQKATLTVAGHSILFTIDGGSFQQQPTTYHPGFGLSLPTHRLVVNLHSNNLQSLMKW